MTYNVGSIPGISQWEHANTSLFLISMSIKDFLWDTDNFSPTKTTFSGLLDQPFHIQVLHNANHHYFYLYHAATRLYAYHPMPTDSIIAIWRTLAHLDPTDPSLPLRKIV